MDETPDPRRKRMRLEHYDYSLGGGYFLTIDVLGRRPIFGNVASSEAVMNELGIKVAELWTSLGERYAGVLVDEWIVMPDHLHGILGLTSIAVSGQLPSVIDVVRDFKSRSTRAYWDHVNQHGLSDWHTKLWQRSYYERVIRSESDLAEKRNYIRTNPRRWELKRAEVPS